jgi:hypothetical protein
VSLDDLLSSAMPAGHAVVRASRSGSVQSAEPRSFGAASCRDQGSAASGIAVGSYAFLTIKPRSDEPLRRQDRVLGKRLEESSFETSAAPSTASTSTRRIEMRDEIAQVCILRTLPIGSRSTLSGF